MANTQESDDNRGLMEVYKGFVWKRGSPHGSWYFLLHLINFNDVIFWMNTPCDTPAAYSVLNVVML